MSGDDETAVAAANARLLTLRAQRAASAPSEPAPPRRDPQDAAHDAAMDALGGLVGRLQRLRPMTEREEFYDRMENGFAEIGRSMQAMQRRMAERGIHPKGDIAAGLMAWNPEHPGWVKTREAMDALGGRCSMLLLTGNTGAGKSTVAGRLVVERRVVGENAAIPYFVSAQRLSTALATPFDDERKKLAARCEAAAVVAIDDLLRVKLSEAQLRALQEFVAMRAPLGRLSIFTSNLEPKPLVEAFIDSRVADRIRGRFAAVHFTGDSLRGRKA